MRKMRGRLPFKHFVTNANDHKDPQRSLTGAIYPLSRFQAIRDCESVVIQLRVTLWAIVEEGKVVVKLNPDLCSQNFNSNDLFV